MTLIAASNDLAPIGLAPNHPPTQTEVQTFRRWPTHLQIARRQWPTSCRRNCVHVNAPKRRSLHIDAATFVAMKYIPADPLTCLDVTSPSTSIISPKTVALQFSSDLERALSSLQPYLPRTPGRLSSPWAADQTQAVYVRGTYLMLSLREVKEVLLIPVIASSQRRAN